LDEAIAQFEKLLELQPDDAAAHNNLGWVLLEAGRVNEAITQFQLALSLPPGMPMAHNNLALALLRIGQAREAAAHYRAFLELYPDNVPVLSDLAWVLATWPDPAVRDGRQALTLARHANDLTGGQDPMTLRALAAAYAENEHFTEAITAIRQAQGLAAAQTNPALANVLRSQLELYQANTPFREPINAGMSPEQAR